MADTLEQWLQTFIQQQGGVAGTVHLCQTATELRLAAAVNIPLPVVTAVDRVPSGKGLAGLALSRNAPVTTCDLQNDGSGDVQAGARAVNAHAGVALPVHDPEGEVRAVVGIAFAEVRSWDEQTLGHLRTAAERLPSG